jgi:hypothetical protein
MTAVTDRDHLLVTFVQGSLDLVWRQVYVVYQAGLLWIAEETNKGPWKTDPKRTG